MYDGELVINVDPTTGLVGPIGDIEGSQTYKAQWRGPWIGLNLQWNVDYCFDVFAEYQYHWTEFDGLGDGDLMPEYAGDFKQHAHGKGHLFKVGGEFNFHDGWILGLGAEYQFYRTYKGWQHSKAIEPVVDAFGNVTEQILPTFQKLHWVNWRSIAFTGSLGYDF